MLLYQPIDGYCYNSDSLFLYDFISSFSPKGRVLDIGAGSGVLGLLVARDFAKVELEAIEKQEVFVTLAQRNAKINKIDYSLHVGDFLDFNDSKGFDYIISNPPFYHDGATKSSNDVKSIARSNSHLPIKEFIKKVAKLLKTKAHFIFCYDAKQLTFLIAELEANKLRVNDVQFVHSKRDRSASIVMIHARKNSNALTNILEPFFSFEDNEVSKNAQRIYDKARTHTIKCQI